MSMKQIRIKQRLKKIKENHRICCTCRMAKPKRTVTDRISYYCEFCDTLYEYDLEGMVL